MRTLITGSAGFVGSHIRRQYPDAVACDIKNGWDCRDLFTSDDSHFDLVFHCAATVGGREGIDFNSAFLAADNFTIDGAMWRWALKTKPGRVVYFSSAAAYPTRIQNAPHRYRSHETDAFPGQSGEPDESYGWVKLMGEMVAKRVRKAGVPVTVVRPFSTYNVDQDPDYPWHQFAMRAHRHDDPFIVWGTGEQVRDWIHIDDLVAALVALVENNVNGPVNLGTGRALSMNSLASMFMEAAGYTAPIEHLLDKPMGVMYRVADHARLREWFVPQISVEEGITRSLEALAGTGLKLVA